MDFDYFNYKSTEKVIKGSLILSQPLMKDFNFNRSIILICEHSSEGSLGYKLNDKIPTESIVSDLNLFIKEKLFIGGPVEKSYLNFIHNSKEVPSCIKITNDVFLGGDIDYFLRSLRTNSNKIKYKFFSGYSGWASDQLDNEIEENSWIVINDYEPSFMFDGIDDKFWSTFLKQFGGKNKIFSNYPKDSSLN